MWIWPHARVGAPFLWGAAFTALFPGNIISTWLIEKLFWESSLSLTAMLALEVPIMVGINALLWFIIIGLIRNLVGRRLARSSSKGAAP